MLEKNSCATTNTYNKFVLRSIIISSQELRPEREREKEVDLRRKKSGRERECERGWSGSVGQAEAYNCAVDMAFRRDPRPVRRRVCGTPL